MKSITKLSLLLGVIATFGFSTPNVSAATTICGVIKVNGQDTTGVSIRLFDCVTTDQLGFTFTGPTEIMDGMAHNYMITIDPSDARIDLEYQGCTASIPCGTLPAPDADGKIVFDYDLICGAPPGEGTATPGFWKNHPEAWPVLSIEIGGVTYTQSQAIALMQTPEAGDKSYNVFRHLVSAKLNVLNGTDGSCVTADIAAADTWMASHAPGSGVAGKSAAWRDISGTANRLDQYNNGLLCAPHRD